MGTAAESLLKKVEARYDRVLVQGEELGGSIQAWIANNGIIGRAEIADDRLSWSLHVEAGNPPLEDWGHLYGEAVHNLRACLDNLAWALANLDGPPQKPKAVQFPIVDDRTKWEFERSRVAELPLAAREAIELIQPFQRDVESSDAPSKDALVLLRDMTNTEKHRVALLNRPGFSGDWSALGFVEVD
jgi:hypothetical protein